MTADGTVYYPSNSDERYGFEIDHCLQCRHTNPDPSGKKQCVIWACAVAVMPGDSSYPSEWVYKKNEPTCTKWQMWDWENNGDPDDPNNPNKAPDPPDPNQLKLFPHIDVYEKLSGIK